MQFIMGRGNWYRYDAKQVVENCEHIDIRKLSHARSLVAGSYLNLTYKVRGYNGESKTISENIHLDWTPCHLGGKRVWWLCPKCGRRIAILYLRLTQFQCRTCHNLTYRSSQESQLDRHLRKKFKLCDKLGIEPMESPLFKPKFMHQKTFDRLCWKHTLAARETTADLTAVWMGIA